MQGEVADYWEEAVREEDDCPVEGDGEDVVVEVEGKGREAGGHGFGCGHALALDVRLGWCGGLVVVMVPLIRSLVVFFFSRCLFAREEKMEIVSI